MKKALLALAALAALVCNVALGATLIPVPLLNPVGSTAGQAIVSTGASSAPAWGGVGLSGITAIPGNTVVANASSASASPSAFTMSSCSGASAALGWVLNSGFACNTAIQASSLSGPAVNGAATYYPTVATNSALQALSTATTSTVTRLGFYASGDVPPLTYTASASACSLNAGSGDNGSQVQSANSKCWIATFPSGGFDVREWGAKPDGTTSDTAAIQAAINYAAALSTGGSGGVILLRAAGTGAYGIDGTGVSLPAIVGDFDGLTLSGEGQGTSLIRLSGANALITVNGGRSTIRDLALNGNSLAASGVIYNKSSFNDGIPNYLERVSFLSFTTQGIYNQQGDSLHVDHCYFLNSGAYALYSYNSLINSGFTNNFVQGSGGLYLTNTGGNQAEGVSIVGNKILPTNSGGIGIYVNYGLEIQIIGNIIDQINTSGILIHNNSSLVKMMGNWFGGGSGVQLGVYDNANGIFVTNNTFSGGTGSQVLFDSSSLGNINSVTVSGNYNYNISSSGYGLQFLNVKRASISGNLMPGTSGTGSIYWGAGNTGTVYGTLCGNAVWTSMNLDNTVSTSCANVIQ